MQVKEFNRKTLKRNLRQSIRLPYSPNKEQHNQILQIDN